MTMLHINLVDDLRPHRARAAEITAAIVECEPGALDDAAAFFAELDERFVTPLTATYESIPVELRAINRRHDIEQQDAIGSFVTAFAGAWELAAVRDFAQGWAEPSDDASPRTLELEAAGLRYRERFGIEARA